MRQKMSLNLMRRLQLGFMGLQLDLPHRDLVFQLTIPLFKPRPRLPRNKENNSDDKREKRATPDIGPIKLKQMPGLASDDRVVTVAIQLATAATGRRTTRYANQSQGDFCFV